MGVHGGLYHFDERLVLVAYLVELVVMDVVALALTVAARVEGRVGGDEVNGVDEVMPRKAARLYMWKMVPGEKLSWVIKPPWGWGMGWFFIFFVNTSAF